ncbi:MAG: GAF domain-containing protein, partial [Candidatus Promineifilaceae bacterium]
MNVIRDFSLRYKLLFVFVLLALSMVAGLLTLRQLIILQFSENVLPTQNVVSEFGYLVKEIQSETLEYVSLGQAETTQEFAQTAAQLADVANQLPTLANDSGKANALSVAKATALALITASESVLTSHSETLSLLEALEEAETEKETLVATIDRGPLLDNPDIRPVILSLNQIVVLTERLHTETLEYTLTGSSSTLAELAETRATLQAELETAQAALASNNLAQSLNAQFFSGTLTEIMGLSEQIVDNHGQTLLLLDQLEQLESDAEQVRFNLQALVQKDAQLLIQRTDTSLWAVGIFGQSVFIVLAILIARALVQPLLRLNSATQKLGQGEYNTRLAVTSKDEIGSLMLAFNGMAEKMGQAVADFQQHTQSIETSSKVSHRLSTILNVEELTTAVVELLKVQFNYYHAHIYLFDEAREYLKMVGGTGIAGQTLLESGHKIKAGQGLVGRTAQTNTPTLVPDVTQEPSWLPNPLLPDTQAEAAVPITLEGEVLGVLDIQNRQIGSLGPDDVELLQSVAWQVAIGLQNARLFEQVQKEKAQVQATLDAISLPIFISKVTDGTFFYFNDPALNLIGLSRHQLTGRPSFNFYDNVEDRTQFLAKLREERQVDNYELALKRNNGERFWASLNARIVTFNGETAVMSTIIDITEQRQAQANLIRRAVEMETVAEVGTATATILDPTQLLNEVVNLIKSQFDLYHAHIHMLNDSNDTLVLTAGAGDIGRQMVEEGRRIPLKADGSLVASVARKIQGSIRNYEGAGEGFMPHPLLEKTRSEMAVPMAIGGNLLGVLDVRSEKLAYFTEADIQTYTILATQIAVALQNARSYARSEEALKDLQALSRRLTREGWGEYLSDQPELAYNYDLREVRPYLNGNGHRNGETGLLHPENPPFTQPLQIQGETIGQLTLPGLQTQDAETVEIVTAVAQRLSAHLENLRLTESSEVARANAERRNAELGLINRMMSSVTASLNLAGNMQIIAQELAEAINVSHVGIALLTEDKQNLEVVSEFPEPTDDVIGTLIPIKGNPLTEQAIQTSKFAMAYDAQNNPLTEPIHDLMRQRNVHMLGVVPMIVGNEFFGTVGFDQTDSQRIMSEQEMRLAETIVYQAATVVQNARLFKQTQEALAETNEQARRLAVLNELSEMLSRQTSIQGVVEDVMAKGPELLDAARLSLHLIDNADKNMLRVVGVAGQAVDVSQDELIPLQDSPMAEALTTRQLVQGYFNRGEEQMQAFFAPLFASGQPIGTFNMAVPQNKPIKENDRQILMQIASILGTTIENQRLFDQTQARAERERLLNNIVTRVAASLDLQHSLQIIVDEMATALNVDQVRVALLQPEGNELQIIAEHYDPSAPSALGMMVPLAGNELSLEVIRTRKMVVVEDAQNNPRTAPVHAMFREQGINTVVLLPLVVNDEVLGTIGLDILDDRSFDLDTLQLAETIVYQAAVAIQN